LFEKEAVVEESIDVRELRKRTGLTQEEFAITVGVTVSTVNRWENGHSSPSKLTAITLQTLSTVQLSRETGVAPLAIWSAERVRTLRLAARMSYDEFADAVGVESFMIQRWEDDDCLPGRIARMGLDSLRERFPVAPDLERWSDNPAALADWTPTRIRNLRERFKMSPRKFAELVGVSHSTVIRWETGTRPMKRVKQILQRLESEADEAAKISKVA